MLQDNDQSIQQKPKTRPSGLPVVQVSVFLQILAREGPTPWSISETTEIVHIF